MGQTLSLLPTMPKSSLAVLVFFISLVLVSRRLLKMLATRYYKGLEVPQVLVEKSLELIPRDWNKAVYILLSLILLLLEPDPVLEKKQGKRNFVSLPSYRSSKVVFILLTKVVSLHMRLFAIHIRETGFQRFISRLLGGDRSLGLWNDLKNLLQLFFNVFENKKCSGRDNNNGKVCPQGASKLARQLISCLEKGWKEVRKNNGRMFFAKTVMALD